MTSERSVAWLRMAAVSTISTMKVERPRARSSAAPTRENSRSTMPMWAERAGTNEPIWASTAMSAFWRRKVDLPAMLGPVTSQMRASVTSSKPVGISGRAAASTQSFSMKAPLLACLQRLLDHGMAAAADLERGAVVERGPHIALLRGDLGQACLAIELGQRRGDLAQRPAPGRRRQRRARRTPPARGASARSAAETMRLSVSTSSCVVKRTAPAMVWRWRKVCASGSLSIGLDAPAGTSM